MKLILVTGVIGSGKDYFIEQYKRNHPDENVRHIKFAEPIVDLASRMFNVNLADKQVYESWKAVYENRKWLVDIGQNLKKVFGNNIFAKRALHRVIDMRGNPNIHTCIITDFRFPVEFYEFWNNSLRSFEIHFTDFHSERYKIAPEQVSERMAIWLLEQGAKDGQVWSHLDFKKLIEKYKEE